MHNFGVKFFVPKFDQIPVVWTFTWMSVLVVCPGFRWAVGHHGS